MEEGKKVTVILPESAIKELDEYTEKGLFGSRGRAVQALLREHRQKEAPPVE